MKRIKSMKPAISMLLAFALVFTSAFSVAFAADASAYAVKYTSKQLKAKKSAETALKGLAKGFSKVDANGVMKPAYMSSADLNKLVKSANTKVKAATKLKVKTSAIKYYKNLATAKKKVTTLKAAEAAVADVVAKVKALPAADAVKATDKAAVEAAKAAFDALSKYRQALLKVTNAADYATYEMYAKYFGLITVTDTAVTDVKAANQKTLDVTGTSLYGLKATDIVVAGNTVVSVTPSVDGKTAKVALGTELAPATDTKVTVTVAGAAKDYIVNYKIVATKVAIKSATYDTYLKNQRLVVLVDGIETSIDYLMTSGYSLTFNAYDKTGTSPVNNLFATGTSATSTDGKLSGLVAGITEGDYKVSVTLSKAGTILVSDKADISITKIDKTSGINEYKLFKGLLATGVEMKSTTLVGGETAFFSELVVAADGTTVKRYHDGAATPPYSLKSSNPAVIAVNDTTGVMTAGMVGTSKITITVGKATKEVDITVAGVARKVTSVVPKTSPLTIFKNLDQTTTVAVYDQYGDPVRATNVAHYKLPTSITGLTGTNVPVVLDTTNNKGEGTVTFTGTPQVNGEVGTVTFQEFGKATALNGTIAVKVSENATTSTVKVEFDKASSFKNDDANINTSVAGDGAIQVKLNDYNGDGALIKTTVLTGYKVKFDPEIIAVRGVVTGGAATGTSFNGAGTDAAVGTDLALRITAVKEGTTNVVISNDVGNVITSTVIGTVTVTKSTIKITGIAWKSDMMTKLTYAKTLTYVDALSLNKAIDAKDDEVTGLTLSTSTPYPVRFNKDVEAPGMYTTGVASAKGDIYIDNNNNGKVDVNDTKLGTLTMSYSPVSGAGVAPGATPTTNSVDGYTVSSSATAGFVSYSFTDTVSVPNVTLPGTSIQVEVK